MEIVAAALLSVVGQDLDAPTRKVIEELWMRLEEDDPKAREEARGRLRAFLGSDAKAAWVRKALDTAPPESRAAGSDLLERYDRKQGWVVFVSGVLGSGVGPVSEDTQINVIRPDGSGRRQLTSGNGRRRRPAFSPDGTKVVFASDDEIREVGVDNGSERVFVGPVGPKQPVWNPLFSSDGRKLYFELKGERGIQWLYVVATDRSRLERISEGNDLCSLLSPDGRSLVFTRGEPGRWDIFCIDTLERDVRRLTADGRSIARAISPDGRWIAFEKFVPKQHDCAVSLLDMHGEQVRRLTDARDVMETFPTFTPDGRIIFLSSLLNAHEGQPRCRILSVDPNGKNGKVLSQAPEVQDPNARLFPSLDGRRLLIEVGGPYKKQISTIDLATGAVRKFADGSDPCWGPRPRN